MNKFFIILFSIFYFLFSPAVFAARLVPKNAPLQPFPDSNVVPNLSQNINSPGNANNLNSQQTEQQANPAVSAPAAVEPGINPPVNPVVPVVENIPPSQSVWVYWVLLILGVLGLGGILLRLYIRFR